MSENNTPRSAPPVAQNLVILSADLLAVEVEKLLNKYALGSYERYRNLREALDTYTSVRLHDVTEPDPQATNVNEPAPTTKRSGDKS